jgi:molecular chaperone DnaK (HSP70)
VSKAAYGTNQRETMKSIINSATNRNDAKILTRPVAAAVIINNKRLNDEKSISRQSTGASNIFAGEILNKIIFDITDGSMDSSVIHIKDSKDFQVLSNVGDTSFGLNDIDERFVEHLVKERSNRKSLANYQLSKNVYYKIVSQIKRKLAQQGGQIVIDLNTMIESGNKNVKKLKQFEILIDQKLVLTKICKDIYDWSFAHIDKSIHQADIKASSIDEIILIGTPEKMPGFYELLKQEYPNKLITFVSDDELAVGAAIVVILII